MSSEVRLPEGSHFSGPAVLLIGSVRGSVTLQKVVRPLLVTMALQVVSPFGMEMFLQVNNTFIFVSVLHCTN